ncbi:MAG: hypothetical protein ABIM59_02150 [candidate division WOR-3 bacterium]
MEVSCEASSKDEALAHADELMELYMAVLEKFRMGTLVKSSKRRGKSEAVEVLKILEERLIPSSFFSQPKSTAEVREKIAELVNIKFQSRKVSQALGILFQKNILSRIGSKGEYKYYLKK